MALNVGADFKTRWLKTPVDVRQTYIDELNHVCDLLSFDTDFPTWQKNDQELQVQSQARIENAYAAYKAELIEAARIREQHALEQSLHMQRQSQQAYIDALIEHETAKHKAQQQAGYDLQAALHHEYSQQAARYQKVSLAMPASTTKNNKNKVLQPEIQQVIENIQIRLELEAEGLMQQIQQAVSQLNHQLQDAAEEELDIALNQNKASAK